MSKILHLIFLLLLSISPSLFGYSSIESDDYPKPPWMKWLTSYALSTFEPDARFFARRRLNDRIKYEMNICSQNGGKFVSGAPVFYCSGTTLYTTCDGIVRCQCD